jgi:hypothetical protein
MRRQFLVSLAFGLAVALVPAGALAGPPTNFGEVVAKYVPATPDFFQVDRNGNFAWNGSGGGDQVVFVAPGAGIGTPAAADVGMSDGDELCKVITSGSLVFCDKNGNGTWDGNGGGDFGTAFSPGAGDGTIFFVDIDGDGIDQIVKYFSNLGGVDLFQIDANQDGSWNGTGGGDQVAFVAPGAGPGTPFACDCDGNGTMELGKTTDGSTLLVDLNNNLAWDGNGGGDLGSAISPGAGMGTLLFADTDGTNGDNAIKYFDDLGGVDLFQVDENGNFVWNGTGGGDAVVFIAPGVGSGIPCAIDPEGDGTKVLCKTTTGSGVYADANGNGTWDGNGGGDVGSLFSPATMNGGFVTVASPAPAM